MMNRPEILNLAHDSSFAGHLGVNKIYNRILRHFFWPGLKSDVENYCRSCHVCQVTGKPNQNISPAPLHPIPTIGEPFKRVIVDCVGPLPHTKSINNVHVYAFSGGNSSAKNYSTSDREVLSNSFHSLTFHALYSQTKEWILCHVCLNRL